MIAVDPIKDRDKIIEFEEVMKFYGEREHMLFLLGIYTGLRISDILKLKVRDVKDKGVMVIREQKTGKTKTIAINSIVAKQLRTYTIGMDDGDYLIGSRQEKKKVSKATTFNKKTGQKNDFRKRDNDILTRQRVWQILKKAANEVGLDYIGCHTLRKTFGYHNYNETKNIGALMKLFNHSREDITLRYIGIEQDSLNTIVNSMDFRKRV